MDLDTPLPVVEASCGCGCVDPNEPVLDAREIPHAVRHGAILGALDALAPGAGVVLVAPHDPVPLLEQVRARFGPGVEVDYLQRDADEWRLRITPRPA